MSHLSQSKQRDQDFYYIGPHHLESIWLIGDPKKLPALTSLQQLAKDVDLGRIAELNGAYYGEEFAKLKLEEKFARQLVVIGNIQDKLALLRAGRVNAILEDDTVLAYWQQKNFPQAQRYQKLLLVYQSPVYFGFSKKAISPQQFKQLQQAWLQLEQTGELAKIQAIDW